MHVHIMIGTGSCTTSTTNMYNKTDFTYLLWLLSIPFSSMDFIPSPPPPSPKYSGEDNVLNDVKEPDEMEDKGV